MTTNPQILEASTKKPAFRFSPMPVLSAAAAYFALVFGTGFILGLIRVLCVVPHVGERNAELIESPLMVVAVFLAARWALDRFKVGAAPLKVLAMGIIALALLVIAEVLAVLWLRGLSISEYVQDRDPVSGTAYLLMLAIFALMPWLVSRRATSRAGRTTPLIPGTTKGDCNQ